jgi:hypothetical protein
VIGVLLAMAQPAALPPVLIQLRCEMAVRGPSARRAKWPASIRLDIVGSRVRSALLEGPAPFSSYSPAPGRKALLHKRDQWRGSFQKDAIRLRRTGTDRVDLVLESKAAKAGAYSGFWTHVVAVEQRPVVVEGTIVCQPVDRGNPGGEQLT